MAVVPSHKTIPGTGFAVDAFKYPNANVTAYFLTHAHSDHYGGLSERWDAGLVYCSEMTGRLITHMLGVRAEFIRTLPMDTSCSVNGVEVVLVDANHCPGAVQYLFRLPSGERYIHCGDMRFGEHLLRNPFLQAWRGRADAVFLDTTYCHKKHVFPPQEETIGYVAATIQRLMQDDTKRIYIISTYGIGKERILLEVHRRCKCRIYVSQRKLGVMRCLELPGLDVDKVFTTVPSETPIHVTTWGFCGESFPFFKPNWTNMESYRNDMGAAEAIGFVPTGWTYEMKNKSFPVKVKGCCAIHLVGYSEHSSYAELLRYVHFLRPHRVIPTVGVEGEDGEKRRAKLVEHFRNLVNETASKAKFLAAFSRARPTSGALASEPSDPELLNAMDSRELASVDDAPSEGGEAGAGLDAPPGEPGAPEALCEHPCNTPTEALGEGGTPQAGEGGGPAPAPADNGDRGDASRQADVGPGEGPAMGDPPATGGSAASALGGDRGSGRVSRQAGARWGGPHAGPRLVEDDPSNADSASISSSSSASQARLSPQRLQEVSLPLEPAPSRAPGSEGESAGGSLRGRREAAAVDRLMVVVGEGEVTRADAAALLAAHGADLGRALNAYYDQGTRSARPGIASAGTGMDVVGSAALPATPPSVPATAGRPEPGGSPNPSDKRSAPSSASRKRKPGEDASRCRGGKRGRVRGGLGPGPDTQQRHITAFFATTPRAMPAAAPKEEADIDRARAVFPVLSPLASSASQQKRAGGVPCCKPDLVAVEHQAHGGASAAPGAKDEDGGGGDSAMSPPIDARTDSSARPSGIGTPSAIAGVSPVRQAQPEPGDTLAGNFSVEHSKEKRQAGFSTTADASDCYASPEHQPGTLAPAAASAPDASADAGSQARSPAVEDLGPAKLVADIFKRAVAMRKSLRERTHPNRPAARPDKPPAGGVPSETVIGPPADCGAEHPPPASGAVAAIAAPAGMEARGRGGAAPGPDPLLLPASAYDPKVHAGWAAGEAAPYLVLARAFAALEGTTKRLIKDTVLVNMFRSVLALAPEDLVAAAYLACGKVAPEHEGIDLNIGGATVSAAIVEATGTSRGRLRQLYTQLGDLGDVAQACRRNQTMLAAPAALTLRGVYSALRSIAQQAGAGAAGRRKQTVLGLLRACREGETRYLVRALVQNLRVGASWRSVLGSLARAVALHRATATGIAAPGKVALDAAAAAASDAFHVCPSLDVLVPALVAGGPEGLAARISLTPGVPLKPMLAKITEGVADTLRQLRAQAVLAEFKYDGIRAQIHLLADGSVRVFSRNCEDRSRGFPDVADAIRAAASGGARECVLDAEIVAVDRASGGLRSFQELSTRARGEVTAAQVTVPVCVFAFDLLYADGQACLSQPLRERRRRLAGALPKLRPGHVALARAWELPPPAAGGLPAPASIPGVAAAAEPGLEGRGQAQGMPALDPAGPDPSEALDLAACPGAEHAPGEATRGVTAHVADAENGSGPGECASMAEGGAGGHGAEGGDPREERLREILADAFAAGTEGIMLKALDVGAAYQPSKRSESWLKIKKDYCAELRDSLDLVPIGAWHGNGRKTGWFSPFLLAAWDPEAERFQSVCRCMSGFSDAFYVEATARLKERAIPGRKAYYETHEAPDVWFEEGEVWELRGADLTLSNVHRAAAGRLHPTRGVSMRFPRFVRIRDDKRPEEASGPDEICALFQAQTRKMGSIAAPVPEAADNSE